MRSGDVVTLEAATADSDTGDVLPAEFFNFDAVEDVHGYWDSLERHSLESIESVWLDQHIEDT